MKVLSAIIVVSISNWELVALLLLLLSWLISIFEVKHQEFKNIFHDVESPAYIHRCVKERVIIFILHF